MSIVSIIGTAGRNEDYEKLTVSVYEKMYEDAKGRINANDVIQSGGAAWADHLAVRLHLELGNDLYLFLPAAFNLETNRYVNSWAGKVSNYYHDRMNAKYGQERSYREIAQAINTRAKVRIYSDFQSRNLQVAKCNYLIAYTFGRFSEPKDGGTSHTWKNSNASSKIHVPISLLDSIR